MKRIAILTAVALSLGFSPAYADSEEAMAIANLINQDITLTREIDLKLTRVEQWIASVPQDYPYYNDYLISRQNTKNDMLYVSQRIQSNTELLVAQLAKDATPQSPSPNLIPSPEPSPSLLEIAQPQPSPEPAQVVTQEPSSLPTPEPVVSTTSVNNTIVSPPETITPIVIEEVVQEVVQVSTPIERVGYLVASASKSVSLTASKKKSLKKIKKKVIQ